MKDYNSKFYDSYEKGCICLDNKRKYYNCEVLYVKDEDIRVRGVVDGVEDVFIVKHSTEVLQHLKLEVEKLKDRLRHATKRAKQFKDDFNGRTQELTFHAGRNQGYWEGRQSVLEDVLDELENDYEKLD